MKILIKFMSKIKAFIKVKSAKLYATTRRQNYEQEIGKTWTSRRHRMREKSPTTINLLHTGRTEFKWRDFSITLNREVVFQHYGVMFNDSLAKLHICLLSFHTCKII